MEIKDIDALEDNAIALYEREDNYSNRTIVVVIENDNKFLWGVLYLIDDPDPEAPFPNLFVKGQGMEKDKAIEAAQSYFNML